MNAPPIFRITLDWSMSVSDLPAEIQERQTQNLYRALRQHPDVETVTRVADPNPPQGSMGAAWLRDLLLTEVIPGNVGSILQMVQQRLLGTPVDIKIEVDGQKKVIEMKRVRPEDFDTFLAKVIAATKEIDG